MKIVFLAALLNLSAGCRTNYGLGAPCVFPYRFQGELFFTCTVRFSKEDGVVPMCPLSVEPITLNSSTNESDWGRCHDDCPLRRYQSNTQIRDRLIELADSFPQLAQVYSLQNRSVLGEELSVIKLTGQARQERTLHKPMVRIIGNMHGNEVTGREVLVQLARLLVLGYDLDQRIRNIMDRVEVHLLPTMNPDGYNRATEGECGGQDYASGRLNENKVDLNRDFPTKQQLQRQSVEELMQSRQPETQAVARWTLSEPWVLSANLHDGAVVATYPWDHYPSDQSSGVNPTLDDNIFRKIGLEYATSHLTMSNSSACKKYSYLGPIKNGADWYPKNGTLKDFGYLMGGGLEFVLELSCCKFIKDYFLPREFENNREALLGFLERSLTAVTGIVLDLKGQPIPGARVTFTQNGKPAGKDAKTSSRGEFWKILVPGSYRVQAVQEGCLQSPILPLDVSAGTVSEPLRLAVRRKFFGCEPK